MFIITDIRFYFHMSFEHFLDKRLFVFFFFFFVSCPTQAYFAVAVIIFFKKYVWPQSLFQPFYRAKIKTGFHVLQIFPAQLYSARYQILDICRTETTLICLKTDLCWGHICVLCICTLTSSLTWLNFLIFWQI